MPIDCLPYRSVCSFNLIMFFRIKTTRSGQALQLVESYRNQEGKPRQRIVVSLADLEVPERHRKALGRLVEEGKWSPVKLEKAPAAAGAQTPPGDGDQGVIDGVLAQSVSHTHTTSMGPVLAGLH